MTKLAFASRQSPGHLTQGFGSAQLAEQHGHELSPTAEAARMPFCLMLVHRLGKCGSRNKLENLRENAAYSIQG
jgi:hypothetical protein